MKNISKFLLRSIAVAVMLIITSFTASAADSTQYYSKVTATSSGNGKVYVSTTSDVTESQIAETSHSASHGSQASSNGGSEADHTYYLYAKGDPGFGFDKWDDGNTANPRTVSVKATSTDESKPSEYSYQASFLPAMVSVKCSDNTLGKVSIDKSINAIGDVVTVTATKLSPLPSSEFSTITQPSQSNHFIGWYDGDGNKVSDDLSFKYTVTKPEALEARFEREFAIKHDDAGNIEGYYRMETPFRRANQRFFLCLTGDFKTTISLSKRYLSGAVEFNQVLHNSNSQYATTDAVFSNAGSILYVTGKADLNKINSVDGRTQVASNLNAQAQGTSTQTIAGGLMTLKTANTAGYYIIFNSSLSLQLTYEKRTWVTTDKPSNDSYVSAGDFDIQPVDEEHIDTNYFGPYFADDSSMFAGAYWTTMYTSFPYQCYEPDGVTAYAVTHVRESAGLPCPILKEIKSGIVPAETPVVLRCKSRNPKENRLIPLLPGDSRLEYTEFDALSNVLVGDYALWKDENLSGRTVYDDASMRLFMVKDGEPGFYRVETAEATSRAASDVELEPNRAYLDMVNVPEELKNFASYPLRIEDSEGNVTGIDGTVMDVFENESATEYYTLDGIRVTHPEKGRFYIVRKGSRVSKIIY